MISQSAEYSLRAVLCLAAQRDPLTTQQIARRARIPAGYLAKIMQTLVRAHIVTSQRGLNGGFCLAVPANTLTLLDVVAAVEPSRRITHCPLDNPDHAINLCPLHHRLDQAAAAVESILRSATLSQVLSESSDPPLCKHPKEGCSHAGHEPGRN